MIRTGVLCLLVSLQVWADPIEGKEAISIGGIKQWISYQGQDSRNPVLLFLHGGPGNSAMSYADRFTGELVKHFTVVFWDQRESGKTATLNPSPKPLTVSRFVQDAIEVIDYLCNRFAKKGVYLVGHSWGGYLALRIAEEKPDRLLVCIAMSPMIHQEESERISLNELFKKAEEQKNEECLRELKTVQIPFANAGQLYIHRKWLNKLLMNNPSPSETRVRSWSVTWLSLFNEASKTDFVTQHAQLNCPVYLFIGSRDHQTHFSLAESYYQKLNCPEKKLYWFTQSAHNPHLTETDKFQKTLIEIRNQIQKTEL
jgi:pimeloyl-ACP methyl ester carboxylesterase